MRRARTVLTLVVLSGLAALPMLAAACGSAAAPEGEAVAADASVDHVVSIPTVAAPDAAVVDASLDAGSPRDADAGVDDGGVCNVRLDMPPLVDSPHVAEGTAVVYGSNPPSSGPHYPVWANFQEFTHPVDDAYLVHSLEHGAVLLLYKCPSDAGACDAMVQALRTVRNAVPDDPLCDPAIRTRVILAPRAANDVSVAAAAWGNTYRADCVDAPSLAQFIAAHYAKSPENLCVAGSVF